MAASFIHLHVHTEYSLVDGLIRLKPLVKETLAAGMPAVAVTDMSNLFAMVKFYKAAQAAGVKPIIGADLWVQREQAEPARLTLLCQNDAGYRNLARLVSRSYLEGQQRGVPVVQHAWLEGATDGLIALSGGWEGELGRVLLSHKIDQAQRLLADWRQRFPDRFYLEGHRTGRPGEEEYLQAAIDLAAESGAPLVATNDVRFLRREEFEAHEARVCIQEGVTLADPRRARCYSDQQYLRSPVEMAALFADLPEALANSVEIARRCNLELELGRNVLPAFPVPEGMDTESYFAAQARTGLEQRLERLAPRADPASAAERRRQYGERLERELGVICQMGFPGYFLIVADFIQWARDHGVPVGPGRGSGAGSLVAYALGITDLDPLAYDLLFERFLNPERVSMPDFDVDFCMEGRDRVIDYVAARYGRDRVSQIATHGSMAAKAVVRDVGRVLGYPLGFVDRIAKLIPFEIGITLDKALAQEEDFRKLYQQDGEVRNLIDLARALEGLARNVGRHAGGVVIAPSPLTDFSPLYCEQGSEALVTQFDKDDVELAGLVKFDFLGLRTLTIIDWALQTINRQRAAKGEPLLDMTALPLADAAAFDLLKACRTTAVFQLESRGMKDLIKRLQPDCFEDIIALVALFRPGPLQSGMVDDFIDRKHGRARVEYPHPDLAPILKPTYGVILYQEQVMQIAQVLAGYTLGGADLLRRAMGKKKPEEMAKQRAVFVEGAVARGADRELAGFIFDLMEKFAGYGFNKCVVGETLVADPDSGELRTVKDLFRNGIGRVASLQENRTIGCCPVAQVMENGIRPVFRLTTALGKRIVATANHPLLTATGWKPLSELRVGDRIAAPDRLPVEGKEIWPDHELIALGWTLAEGNTCHPSGFYFYNKDLAARDDFIAAVSGFPDTRPTVRQRQERADTWEVYVGTGQQARFKTGSGHNFAPRSGARLWLEGLGMIGHKAGDKRYPTGVFRLDNRCLALLLGRLWSGDGYISGRNGNNMIPCLATASERLARETQHLLLRLGMVSRLTEKRFPYKEGRTGYTLHLLGRTSIERFVAVIGPHLIGRDDSLAALRQALSVERQASHASRLTLHTSRPAQAAADEIFWERIVRLEPAGAAMTYDLEVTGTHNFVANDLLVHNSHSAAYALISYQTAWLKAHYPAAFMAAVLSSDMDKTDKVVVFIEECRSMGLELLPPSVNASDYRFTVDDRGRILYGLGAIKGVGEGAIEGMLEERQRDGPFRDLFDLCRRADLRRLNRRVLECLIRSGACDCLGANRATLMAQLPEALLLAEQNSRNVAAGQVDLFGLPADAAVPKRAASLVEAPEWDEGQRLEGEKETLGLYLTGHPIARFMPELQHFITDRLADVAAGGERTTGYRQGQDKGRRTVVAGLVVGIRTRSDNRGKRMAFVTLDDRSARLEIRVFPEVYEQYRHLIADDKVLVVQGESVWNDFSESMRLNAERLMDLETARREYARRLVLSLDTRQFGNGLLDQLAEALAPYRQGQCQVVVDYARPGARAEIVFDFSWGIKPAEALLARLARLVGEECLRLEYH